MLVARHDLEGGGFLVEQYAKPFPGGQLCFSVLVTRYICVMSAWEAYPHVNLKESTLLWSAVRADEKTRTMLAFANMEPDQGTGFMNVAMSLGLPSHFVRDFLISDM